MRRAITKLVLVSALTFGAFWVDAHALCQSCEDFEIDCMGFCETRGGVYSMHCELAWFGSEQCAIGDCWCMGSEAPSTVP
jgi:hypothetical protein